MTNNRSFAVWWEAQSSRSFTKLECGLLGALFASIGMFLLFTVIHYMMR